jgi:hypothetical protein
MNNMEQIKMLKDYLGSKMMMGSWGMPYPMANSTTIFSF